MSNKPLYFTVDFLKEDKSYAWTSNISRILSNIEKLPKEISAPLLTQLESSEKDITTFLSIGKYMIYLHIANAKYKGGMGFFDNQGDDKFAVELTKNLNKELRTDYMRYYMEHKEEYAKNDNDPKVDFTVEK